MDPTTLLPGDLPVPSASAAPIAGGMPNAGATPGGGFQAVFRETLDAPPPRRGVDLANDLRATAQSMMNLEGYMNAERVRMFRALVPDVPLGPGAGQALDGRGREVEVVRAGGLARPSGFAPERSGDVAYGNALARDADRISLGVRPLYTDTPANVQRGIMAPMVQSAFAVAEGTDPSRIDFATQIERLDNQSVGLMERIANVQRAMPEDATLQDNMRQFGEISALSQQFSAVTTSKAVVAQIYIGVYEEIRNKAMTAVQLIQSSFSKLNQVFNQLKSGS